MVFHLLLNVGDFGVAKHSGGSAIVQRLSRLLSQALDIGKQLEHSVFINDSFEGRHDGLEAGDNLGRAVVITANDGGAAWTPDEGNTWFTLPGVSGYWAVAFASPKAGWLVGTNGRILKISF